MDDVMSAGGMTAPIWEATDSVGGTLFSAYSAAKNRNFQMKMSNTAHQREVRDLRAAGLNPILSARHGGASTPPGSSAQASHGDTAGKGLMAVQLAQQAKLNEAQITDLNSAAALKQAQTGDINMTQVERVDLLIAQKQQAIGAGNLSVEQANKLRQEILNLQAQKKLIQMDTAHSAAKLHKEEVKGSLWKKAEDTIKSVPKFWEHNKNIIKDIRKKSKRNGATGRW